MARQAIPGDKIPVALLLLENYDIDTNVLKAPNSIVEYDILVWNDLGETVFEKSGKVGRKNLEKALSFDARYHVKHYINLEVSATINGKTTKFISLSQHSTLLKTLEENFYIFSNFTPNLVGKTAPKDGDIPFIDPSVETTTTLDPNIAAVESTEPIGMDSSSDWNLLLEHIDEEWQAGGHLDIPIILIEEEAGNAFIRSVLEKNPEPVEPILNEAFETILTLELEAKILATRIKLLKKESLGATVILSEEIDLINNINEQDLYNTLLSLVRHYEISGLANISEYRQGMYKYLKQAADALIVIKGKLESLNIYKKGKDIAPPSDGGAE